VPDIIQMHLLPHIVPAPINISNSLQNKHIANEFYVDSPTDLLYKDSSSVFWLTPVVDLALHKSTGNISAWKTLLSEFTDFCLNNLNFFTRHSDTIIEVNDNTSLSTLFDFKYFHVSQIESILKKITKFLGRKNGFLQSCPFLTHYLFYKQKSFNSFNDVIAFIDDVINNNNNLMPFIPHGLHI
jgi:hypothetical protein